MSVDPPATARRLKGRLQVSFTFLSDPEGVLLDAVGIRHRGGYVIDGSDIAYPTSMLVDERGVVRWLYQADNYRERVKPEAIFAAMDALGPPESVPAGEAESEGAAAGAGEGETNAAGAGAGGS